nr:potassium-transporting ATPase subunit C [Streptomyces sp. NRRL S-1813]
MVDLDERVSPASVPVDAVTVSGSGLDPAVSRRTRTSRSTGWRRLADWLQPGSASWSPSTFPRPRPGVPGSGKRQHRRAQPRSRRADVTMEHHLCRSAARGPSSSQHRRRGAVQDR